MRKFEGVREGVAVDFVRVLFLTLWSLFCGPFLWSIVFFIFFPFYSLFLSQVEKMSEVLGRNALWNEKSRIDRLPKFLCVHMMRFFMKQTPDSADHRQVPCKIMRPCKFGAELDIFDFCSDRVQKILKVPRDKKAQEDEEIAAKKLRGMEKAEKGEEGKEGKEGKEDGGEGDVAMEDADGDEMDEEMKAALAMSMTDEASPATTTAGGGEAAGPGLTPDFMGNYELFGVVCHKGRDSSSGHYTAWVRMNGDNWVVFDDDEVSERKTADILGLNGGGDHHMSYLNFYRAVDGEKVRK